MNLNIFEGIFFLSMGLVVAVTFGYPLFLLTCGFFVRKRSDVAREDAFLPLVSLIISAHDEEAIIEEKLRNSLALDYPPERFEIIVASDGSTDRTDEIVRSFEKHGIRLYRYERIGKTGIQNETVKKANGEILVFSDANAMYKKDAIKKLVRNFVDPRIGCVCGRLIYTRDHETVEDSGESTYWRYENLLKKAEARLSSLVGANGSIYAIRKSDYVEVDNQVISDLVVPLEIVKRGKRVIYEEEAVSKEKPLSNVQDEFHRKVRILTRSIQGILHMKCLFNPIRYGMFSFQVIFHKMLRYFVPFFLMLAMISLVPLTCGPFYYGFYCLVMMFLILAIVAKFSGSPDGFLRRLNLIYYYVVVNYALVLAWLNVIRGKKITVWSTDRD